MSYNEPQFPPRVQGQDNFETRLAPAVQPHERTLYARSTSKDSIAVTPILESRDIYNRASRDRASLQTEARPGFACPSANLSGPQPTSGFSVLLRTASALDPAAGGPHDRTMNLQSMASDAGYGGTMQICHKRKAVYASVPEDTDHLESIGTSTISTIASSPIMVPSAVDLRGFGDCDHRALALAESRPGSIAPSFEPTMRVTTPEATDHLEAIGTASISAFTHTVLPRGH